MSNDEYVFGMDMPKVSLLVRVSFVERLGRRRSGRSSYEMHSISGIDLDISCDKHLFDHGFAKLRVVTTGSRFRGLFGHDPEVGDWIAVQTAPFQDGVDRERRILAWLSWSVSATATHQSRGYVIAAQRIHQEGVEKAPEMVRKAKARARRKAMNWPGLH